ncbi:MAG: hypothetical protein KDK29_11235 [Sedimentitalea sp.]|nr:hypothetical protein [Sedimentitalea sp.]
MTDRSRNDKKRFARDLMHATIDRVQRSPAVDRRIYRDAKLQTQNSAPRARCPLGDFVEIAERVVDLEAAGHGKKTRSVRRADLEVVGANPAIGKPLSGARMSMRLTGGLIAPDCRLRAACSRMLTSYTVGRFLRGHGQGAASGGNL